MHYGAWVLFGRQVFVVVPAYNEAPRISRVLERMPAVVDRVIVVDDGSVDSTCEVVRAYASRAADGGRVTLLDGLANEGVGAAIARGYEWFLRRATHARDVAMVMAGDDQMHPDDLASLAEPVVLDRVDYAKGNRFAWEGPERMPPARRLGGQLFSRLTSVAIGEPIGDSQTGYTAIARDACAKIPLAKLYPRYGYPNDLLGHLKATGARIGEVPVRPVYAGEPSGLRIRHLPTILALVARAGLRARRMA